MVQDAGGWAGGVEWAQRLRLDVVRLPPEKTRGRHGLVRFAPVRHGRPAGHGRCVDDGHGVGGQELVAALVGVAERGGKLRGSVEPEDPDRDSAGRFVAADLEDVGGPEGGVGEVVAGGGDDVVHAVAFVFDDNLFEALETVPDRGGTHDVHVGGFAVGFLG